MRLPVARNWKAQSMTASITEDATPPAAAALLLQSIAWPEDAALTPYVGCAHVFDGLTSTYLQTRYLGVVVAPGAEHARAALGSSWYVWGVIGIPSAPYLHTIVTTASGAAAADVIKADAATPLQKGSGAATFSSESGVVLSSDEKDDAPATSKRRRIELQTLSAPYVEPMKVTECSSFSVAVSHQVADLELL